MNQHTEFARTGESPEQEAHSAPAIRLSLSDIVEEYDQYFDVFRQLSDTPHQFIFCTLQRQARHAA